MTLNGVMAFILRYYAVASGAHCVKMVEDVVVKSSRSLAHLLMSFLFTPQSEYRSVEDE